MEGEQPVAAQEADSNSSNVAGEDRSDLIPSASDSQRQEHVSGEQQKEEKGTCLRKFSHPCYDD